MQIGCPAFLRQMVFTIQFAPWQKSQKYSMRLKCTELLAFPCLIRNLPP